MKKTIIQIYEVQRPGEAEILVDMGVDHIGSVLTESNQRKNATIRKTVRVIRQAGARSGLIPLFHDPVAIFSALDYYAPDFVHLCDALSPFPGEKGTSVREFDALLSLQVDIKDRFPQMAIMRSLSVPQAGSLHQDEIQKNVLRFAEVFAPFSDYFLIDTLLGDGREPVAGYVGITGRVCDWKIAGAVINWSPIPVILAGGLWDQNVYDAIVLLKPAGVDSCTQTNALDKNGRPIRFKKDMKKVRRFIEEAHLADKVIQGGDCADQPIHAKGI